MRFESLQMLRGIAAVWVVAFHMQCNLDPHAAALPFSGSDLMRKGYLGVDLFFVISGFVIAWTALYKPGPHDPPTQFLLKRLIRVAPPYWVATLVFAVLCDPTSIGLGPIIRSLLFLPGAPDTAPNYGNPVLLIGWSLNYEIYFYIAFAAILYFGRNLAFQVSYFTVTLILLPAILAGGVSTNPEHLYKGISNKYVLLATNPIILEFIFGMMLARLYRSLPGSLGRLYVWLTLLASIAIFATALILDEPHMSIVFRGLPCAILVAGLLVAERYGLLPVSPQLSYLGEISYSIYLTHLFVLLLVKAIYETSPGQHYAQIAQYLITVAAVFALARIFYKYVESPILQFGKRLGNRRRGHSKPAAESALSRVK
ncbi:acyltransferase family protein [Cupriavidus necator]